MSGSDAAHWRNKRGVSGATRPRCRALHAHRRAVGAGARRATGRRLPTARGNPHRSRQRGPPSAQVRTARCERLRCMSVSTDHVEPELRHRARQVVGLFAACSLPPPRSARPARRSAASSGRAA
ncbi:MAG: hypothetical protein MZW92_54200 [Comamonadaceae bacterium]|nr:hypothetical protein [Comamonadaceae bacterium]